MSAVTESHRRYETKQQVRRREAAIARRERSIEVLRDQGDRESNPNGFGELKCRICEAPYSEHPITWDCTVRPWRRTA